MIVCAWGGHGNHKDVDKAFKATANAIGKELHCLTLTKGGQPGHPLYLKKDLKPIQYQAGRATRYHGWAHEK